MVAGETRGGKTMYTLAIIGLKEASLTSLRLATKNSSGGTSPFTQVNLKTRTTLYNGITPPVAVAAPVPTTWSGRPPSGAVVRGFPSFDSEFTDYNCGAYYTANGTLVESRQLKGVARIDLEMYMPPTDVVLLFRRVGEVSWHSLPMDRNASENGYGDIYVQQVFLGCSAALSLGAIGGPVAAIRNNPFMPGRMSVAIRYTPADYITNIAHPLDFEFQAIWTSPAGNNSVGSEILTIGISNLNDWLDPNNLIPF
jgi:hypothetical protein